MSWTNNDGLTVYFDAEEAQDANHGEYNQLGDIHLQEVILRLVDLTESEAVVSRLVYPKGEVLWKVEVITEEPAATGVAIDVGMKNKDGTGTPDPDGVLAALVTASMSKIGETFTATSDALATYGGAYIGTVVGTVPQLLTASRTTSTAFTAGVIRLRLYWYKQRGV